MRTARLDTIRNRARLYADARPGGANAHVTDTELNGLVNAACAEYWDLLVQAGGQNIQGITTVEQATDANNALPSDFYQLLSLHVKWGDNNYEDLGDPIDNVADADYFENMNATWAEGSPKVWWLEGGPTPKIRFAPTAPNGKTLRIRYIPHFTDMSLDADTILTVDAWDKFISLVVACELRTIMGLPNTFLVKLRDDQRQRVEDMAANRRMLPAKVRMSDEKNNARYRFRKLPRGYS